MKNPIPSDLKLPLHDTDIPLSLAFPSEGSSMPASTAMMAMTTRSSISVNDSLFLMTFLLSEDVFFS